MPHSSSSAPMARHGRWAVDIAPSFAEGLVPRTRQFGIAVIGSGPRGVSVIERIGARLLDCCLVDHVTIYCIDADEVGAGRIWRSGQPSWLAMNNRCGEVTIFSGPPDDRAWRPGAGPSFSEWWRRTDARFPGPTAYAPRSHYGRYLRFVLDVVETNLPTEAEMIRLNGLVTDVRKCGDRFELDLNGQLVICDHVVVCSGHPRSRPAEQDAHEWILSGHRQSRARARDAGGAAVDVPRRGTVGIIGLGLTFHDVLASLTVGRGGRFEQLSRTRCEYVPSGNEPDVIVAASRSALPIPARGDAQRPFDFRYAPRLFTADLVARLRATGPRGRGTSDSTSCHG